MVCFTIATFRISCYASLSSLSIARNLSILYLKNHLFLLLIISIVHLVSILLTSALSFFTYHLLLWGSPILVFIRPSGASLGYLWLTKLLSISTHIINASFKTAFSVSEKFLYLAFILFNSMNFEFSSLILSIAYLVIQHSRVSWEQWFMLVIPAIGRYIQVDQEFKVTLPSKCEVSLSCMNPVREGESDTTLPLTSTLLHSFCSVFLYRSPVLLYFYLIRFKKLCGLFSIT